MSLMAPFHIPIVLVPVSPISTDIYDKYTLALSEINTVLMDLQVSSDNKYAQELLNSGTVYLEYVSDYRKDLCYLKEISLQYSMVAVLALFF